MDKGPRWIVLYGLIMLALAGCAGAPAAAGETPTPIPTSAVFTAIPLPGTAAPGPISTAATTLAPTLAPVTLAATASPRPGTLSQADLKYLILGQFGNIFFCDPDYYPVAREISPDEIASRVAELAQQDPVQYQAILRHLGLSAAAALTPEQMASVYADSKKLAAIPLQPTGSGFQFDVRVGDEKAGTAITGTIDSSGHITVLRREPAILTCPICLVAGTRIATPLGAIPIEALRPGMPIWTEGANGERQLAVILRAATRPYAANAALVRLLLGDGRAVLASPAHPAADGRPLGSFTAGDILDGARVVGVERRASASGVTYDVLPSGSTGAYWADGILLESTLAH